VASKLVVTVETTQYSQAVSMAGGNAVFVEMTQFAESAGCDVTVEQGNDLENWEPIAGGPHLQLSGADYKSKHLTQIAAQYVRLMYRSSSGTSILAGGVNVANL
jgi:hypothetical protein